MSLNIFFLPSHFRFFLENPLISYEIHERGSQTPDMHPDLCIFFPEATARTKKMKITYKKL